MFCPTPSRPCFLILMVGGGNVCNPHSTGFGAERATVIATLATKRTRE